MKLSAIALLLITSSPVLAHSDSDCNIDVQGELEYSPSLLTLTQSNGDVIAISDDYKLTINREAVSLNEKQQQWVSEYYDAISEAVPLTVGIASEGLTLANTAITETFGQILGEDDELINDFQDSFEEMKNDLQQRFHTDAGHFRIGGEDSGWVKQAWADEFENRIEDLAERAMGRILMALGTQMITSEESIEDFGERMEAFGENLEERIEDQAEALEDKASELCETLRRADGYENKLQQSVAGLSDFNILNIKSD